MKQSYGEEEIQAVKDSLEAGWLAPGPLTAQFEKEIANRFGKKYGLMVNSGSSANMLAVICAGAVNGAEVITPACTFSTTVAPLVQNNAKVVFCDVEPDCYVPSVDNVIKAVSPNTKVIMIPNLLGNKIDWEELKRRLVEMKREDIVLIEDSCDTITYTPVTDIATVSFYASHIITAGGSGGMVMFNNHDWLLRATQIRDWGRVGGNSEEFAERFNHGLFDDIQYDWKFVYCEFGYNLKSSEMNAAFGLAQFKKLPKFEKIRDDLLHHYIERIKGDEIAKKYYRLPIFKEGILFLAFPLACKDRAQLLEYLEANQVQTRVTMAGNILRHPIFKNKFPEEALKSFPVSDQVMREGFLVGCHHGMTMADVDRVSDLLISFAHSHSQ